MPVKRRASGARVKLHESLEASRSGGEARPYDYPHLYQIQAGDWRISYAVEQNHLAILVLEVLNTDGTVRTDPAHETLTRKMKVKLLDWPAGSPSRDLPPEDLGKKVKIKLLDLVDDLADDGVVDSNGIGTVTLGGAASRESSSRRITLLDGGLGDGPSSAASRDNEDDTGASARKVTPLGSPSA